MGSAPWQRDSSNLRSRRREGLIPERTLLARARGDPSCWAAPEETMRAAIYFTPPPDHPLTRTAALWLGRDAFTGQPMPTPPAAALDVGLMTAEPRRYGF